MTNSSLSVSEEGAVLTMIQRNAEGSTNSDQVISMCKIKSVEYSSLRLLIDLLTSGVEQEKLVRSQDELFSRYAREFRVFSRNIDSELSPHPETFYIDLFSTAYTLLAKRSAKDREMYQDLLFSNSVKFIVLVLAANEEKNSGKRYVGKIDLESSILEQQ